MKKKLLELTDIKKYYASGRSVAMGLAGVSMSFSSGEFVAVTGESGSGKSTLARVIAGIIKYEAGEMYFEGERTSHLDASGWEEYRKKNIAFISQNYDVLPGASVFSNVVSVLRISGMDKEAAAKKAVDILRKVELYDMRRRRAAKLSSGQKQRLSIARALAKPAPILIADEPTGNLDAENSEKIVKMLAELAHDRLVIIVTHDYNEVEGYVTRRITLSDGLIVSDEPVRPAYEQKPADASEASPKNKRGLPFYIAGLQTRSRPVWAAVTGLVFALTAFAVFAFLGVLIINIDDSFTYEYNPTAFENGDEKRIVVTTIEGRPLTDEDYEKMLSLSHIESLDRYDSAVDVLYAYREGRDYKIDYDSEPEDEYTFEKYKMPESVSLYTSAPYIKTVPIIPGKADAIAEGKKPEGFDEVAAVSGHAKIGDKFRVYLFDKKHFGYKSLLPLDVTVVGLLDEGEGLYFSDDVGVFFMDIVKGKTAEMLIYDENVADGTFLCSPTTAGIYNSSVEKGIDPIWSFFVYSGASERYPLRWAGYDGYNEGQHGYRLLSRLYIISPNDYKQIIGNDTRDKQVSLFIEDYAYADRVLTGLHDMGYVATSPYKLGRTEQNEELAAERKQTLSTCITALLVVVAMQVLLLTAIFSAERNSFRILSDLGLSNKSAKKALLWQLLLFTAAGQLVGGIAIFVSGTAGVERIENMLKYLPLPYVLILSAVHLAAALTAGIFILRGIDKHVYPMAAKNRDILIDEETEA